MPSNGYTLTDSVMLNQWIINNNRLCIATKRGLNGVPFFRYFERGRAVFDDKLPLTQALFYELKHYVDIAWLGDGNLNKLASVVLTEDGMLLVEEVVNAHHKTLDTHYKSFL